MRISLKCEGWAVISWNKQRSSNNYKVSRAQMADPKQKSGLETFFSTAGPCLASSNLPSDSNQKDVPNAYLENIYKICYVPSIDSNLAVISDWFHAHAFSYVQTLIGSHFIPTWGHGQPQSPCLTCCRRRSSYVRISGILKKWTLTWEFCTMQSIYVQHSESKWE